MLKRILLILSLASVTVFATQSSRVNSLEGLEGSHVIGSTSVAPMARVSIYDPTDVMIFPHLANQYTDFINIFYTGHDTYSGFGTFNIMPSLTIGIADFNSSKQMWGVENLVDGDGDNISFSAHTYSLFAAYNLGTIDLGLSLNYWSSSIKTETVNLNIPNDNKITTSRTIDTGIFSLNLSLGMDLGNTMGFDSLFKIDFGNYTNEAYNSEADPKTVSINDPDAYMALSLGGRFFMNFSDKVKLTSWMLIDYTNEGYKDLEYNAEHSKVDTIGHERSSTLINIGSSFEIKTIKNKLTVTPSFGVLISSFELKSKDLALATEGSTEEASLSRLTLPYIGLSVEYNIKKWLTVYTGYNKVVYGDENSIYTLDKNNDVVGQDRTDTLTQDKTSSNFAMGLSLQNDTMKFIASLNKDLLLNGPNFISGTTAPMFISATFQWNFGTPKSNLDSEFAPQEVTPKKVTPKKETKIEKVIEEEETPEQTDEEEEDSL